MRENQRTNMMERHIKKIKIGTAQWGLDYGISNEDGKTTKEEIVEILRYAKDRGINSFDTANEYGNAERTVGKLTDQES